jgi:large subunit ribosomal protein L1
MNKKNQALTEKFDLRESKTIEEASKLLPKISTSKFTGSVDIDIVLDLKEKQKKESVRGSINLPHNTGDSKRVIVFCEEKDEEKAKKAGVVEVGLDELVKKVSKGWSDFDVVVATPAVMPKIARLGKTLGPKGLMPNPKTGTVTNDIKKTVENYMSGKMDFKMMQGHGTIRAKIGTLDMNPEEIQENLTEFLKAVFTEVRRLNPRPFKKVTVSPTMGPGIKLDINDIMDNVK